MKIKKLNIKSYRHLEDVNFDFTYPEGHEKAGQPLDKICIIGQSATGKTGILELFKDNISQLVETTVFKDIHLLGYHGLHFDGSIEYLYKSNPLIVQKDTIIRDGKELNILNNGGGIVDELISDGLRLLYFSADAISQNTINFLNQNPVDILTGLSEQRHSKSESKYRQSDTIYEFSQDIDESIWISLFGEVLDYRKKFVQLASEIINKGIIGDPEKLSREYAKWAEVNPNPIIPFAKYFNPVLNKLNLEIDLISTEYIIPIKSKFNDKIIPFSALSTGSKGLLLSLFPLFKLNTIDSIILVDEPERSLFPDLQIDLMSYYRDLAPEAQLIVATHSPFIAAAFEPEERFILYFDKNGKIALRQGESPIGDDPNDMLRNDFNVDYYNKFGKEAYQRYLDLKRRMSQETEPDKKKDLLVELTQLGDKYNF